MIKPLIDLSAAHGAVRHQGARQTCLAFSLSDLNGHEHGQPGMLSVEFLFREAAMRMPSWRPGEGLQLDAALQAVNQPGQPLEVVFPYQADDPPLPLRKLPAHNPMYRGNYGAFTPLGTGISQTLRGGRSVGLVLRVTPEFFAPDAATATISHTVGFMPGQAHAVLAVGIGQHNATGETHYFIRNSWGDDWGRNGHAWLPQSYVDTHALCAFGV